MHHRCRGQGQPFSRIDSPLFLKPHKTQRVGWAALGTGRAKKLTDGRHAIGGNVLEQIAGAIKLRPSYLFPLFASVFILVKTGL
ncbi:hypothetical protein D3C84_454740 [compost metagenome]